MRHTEIDLWLDCFVCAQSQKFEIEKNYLQSGAIQSTLFPTVGISFAAELIYFVSKIMSWLNHVLSVTTVVCQTQEVDQTQKLSKQEDSKYLLG